MSIEPAADRLDDLRNEYAQNGYVASDGAVWLFSQLVVLREQVARLKAAVPVPPPTDQTAALLEAADWFDGGGRSVKQLFGHQVATELRRLAAEAQPTTKPEETGAALARYIADQSMSTIQAAIRILGWPPLRFELVDDEPAAGVGQDGAQP